MIYFIYAMNSLSHYTLPRSYVFSMDEVIVTNLNDNSNGELEFTVHVFMNGATAVLAKAALENAMQVLLLSVLITNRFS